MCRIVRQFRISRPVPEHEESAHIDLAKTEPYVRNCQTILHIRTCSLQDFRPWSAKPVIYIFKCAELSDNSAYMALEKTGPYICIFNTFVKPRCKQLIRSRTYTHKHPRILCSASSLIIHLGMRPAVPTPTSAPRFKSDEHQQSLYHFAQRELNDSCPYYDFQVMDDALAVRPNLQKMSPRPIDLTPAFLEQL